MAFGDKFTNLKAQVATTKTQAQAGGLPATNAAVVTLCDQMSALLDMMQAASVQSARTARRPLIIDDT